MFNNEVVLDEVDRYPAYLLFTPAVTRPFEHWRAGRSYRTEAPRWRERSLGGGSGRSSAALPHGTTYSFHVTSIVEGQVNRTVKPEAIALGGIRRHRHARCAC